MKSGSPASRGMTRSMFHAAVSEVFPSGLGDALVADQVLLQYGMTGLQALDCGVDPLDVWQALLRETGRDTANNLFWHRRDLKPK